MTNPVKFAVILVAWLMSGTLGWAAAPNIVVRHDSVDTESRGRFDEVDAYLSHRGRARLATGSASFAFIPPISEAGYYRVYAWWPLVAGTTAGARVTIHHGRGTTRLSVDQQALGGQWNLLGVFPFAAGSRHSVEMATEGGGRPMWVDATRFQYVGSSPPPLQVDTDALAVAQVGEPYDEQVAADGGVVPYAWESATPLPDGLRLHRSSGRITGKPLWPGRYRVDLLVTDAESSTARKQITIEILKSR